MAIVDRNIIKDKDILAVVKELLNGGVRFIQLRDKISSDSTFLKDALAVGALAKERDFLFTINDRADIAIASSADGVHLGQDDMPYAEARRLVGKERLVGISAHSVEEALAAEQAGADYIGAGPVFKTATKPRLRPLGLFIVSAISARADIPVFFIGGVGLSNINDIIERGARRVAAASAVLKGDIAKNAREMLSALEKE